MEVGNVFLLIKDYYSHYRILYFIKHKSEVKDLIETMIHKIKTETGCKVKVFRTDNGLEFVIKEITSVLQKYRKSHQTTVPYTPEQNGKIEHENRTIIEAARTMLYTRNLSKTLWQKVLIRLFIQSIEQVLVQSMIKHRLKYILEKNRR